MKKKAFVSINVLIIIFELISLYLSIKEFDYKMLTYYTQYSNLLALVSSTIILFYLNKEKPKWLKILRYISVNVLTITFLVVSFILVPLLSLKYGMKCFMMFTYGSMLYHHLLCPILFFISFVFLEDNYCLSKKQNIYVLIPTFAYGIIMAFLNAIQVVDGPYPFLQIDDQPLILTLIWLIILFSFSYYISMIISKISIKFTRKNN